VTQADHPIPDSAPLLGDVQLTSPFVLAPMAGYTEAPFRALCCEQECGLVFTELTSADGLVLGSPRTWSYLTLHQGEGPTAAHIYGSDPDLIARAAERIAASERFALLDINCGCPMPKVTRKGAGVALMRDPQRIAALVAAARRASGMPVTIKTRLGLCPDTININDVACAAADAGAAAVFVHARVATARHSGPADWAALAGVRRRAGIPVIGNGGVTSAEEAVRHLAMGLDGVMIGRAAIGNPWIFRGLQRNQLAWSERVPVILEHLGLVVAHTGGTYGVRSFRKHLRAYLRGSPIVRHRRQALMQCEDADELGHMLQSSVISEVGCSASPCQSRFISSQDSSRSPSVP